MKRNPRSSRRRGLERLLASPVTPVLIGLFIVLGVGYWVMKGSGVDSQAGGETNTQGSGTGKSATEGSGAKTTEPGKAGATKTEPEKSGATKTEPEKAGTAKTEPEKSGATKTEPEKAPAAKPGSPAGSNASAGQGTATDRSHIDRSGGAAKTMLVTAYFADGLTNGMSLQPVEIKVAHTVGRIGATVEQLLNPPTELKLHTNFPAGTRSLGPNLKDGVAIVDLSPEVAEVRGSHAVNTIMASLVYSLTEIPEVKAVQLWVNGRPAVLDGIDWSKPISRADLEGRNLFKVEPVIKYGGS